MNVNILILAKSNPNSKGYICTIGYDDTIGWLRIWRLLPEYHLQRWSIYEIEIEKTKDPRKETYALLKNTIPNKISKKLKDEKKRDFIVSHLSSSIFELENEKRSCGLVKPIIKEYEVIDNKAYMNYELAGIYHHQCIKDQGLNIFIKKQEFRKNLKNIILEHLYKLNVKYIMLGTHARWKKWMLISLYWGKFLEKEQKTTIEKWLDN